MGYAWVFATLFLTVYGQLVVKWQVAGAGSLPDSALGKAEFLLRMLLNPWIASALLAALLAALSWIAAMTKLQLSHAYPFMSLSFVLVLVLSGMLLHEPVTWPKIAGVVLILCGVVVSSQG